jgi:hypothetical protein
MTQPTQDKRGVMLPNLYTPVFDWEHADGSRDYTWQAGEPPVINSVSGTFEDGNVITLTGSNFSTKRSSQLLFTDFSEGVVGQRSEHFHYWNMVGTADYLIVDDVLDAPIGSGKVLRAHPIQQTFTEIHHELDQDADEIYLEAWCRINRVDFTATPDAPQIKAFRVVDGTGEASMQDRPLNVAILFDSAGDLQVTAAPVVGNSAWYGTPPGNDVWAKYTMYMRKGELDEATGERFVHVHSENSFTFSGLPGAHFGSPGGTVASTEYAGEQITIHTSATAAYLFRRIALPYFQRAQQETIVDIAQMYSNDSKERVVIGDASTWAACDHTKTHCVSINNRELDSISFVAEDGQFPSGALYAYVINRDGEYNSNGFLVRAA